LTLVLVSCGDTGSRSNGPTNVDITGPADGSFVNATTIQVSGRVEGTDTLEVQGNDVDAVGGEWSTQVSLSEGEHTVTASTDGDSDSISIVVDTTPPQIQLSSPDRGAFVAVETVPSNPADRIVTVSGRVEDAGSGAQSVALDGGGRVPVDGPNFTREWRVNRGLNNLRVTVTDRAGNQATTIRGVMYGETVDPTATVDDGLWMTLRPGGFSAAASVVEDFMTPERVEQFVRQSVQVNGFTVDDVSFTNLSVSTEVDPRGPNGDSIEAVVSVDDFRLEGTATFSSDPIPMAITVETVTAIVELAPRITSDHILKLEERDSELQLDPADVDFELTGQNGDSSSIDSETIEQIAVSLARGAFRDYVIEQLTSRLYDPAVLNREVSLLGRRLEFTVKPTRTEVSPDGLFLNADLSLPGDRYADVPEVPGALSRTLGDPGQSSGESQMEVQTHQRALDRLLHGAWRAGLFHQVVDSETLSGQNLPVDLNAGALALLLDDRISSLAEPSTPAALRFRPQLPPVASLDEQMTNQNDDGSDSSGAPAGAVDVRVGGMLVDLELRPASGDPIPIVTLAVFLTMDVDIDIDGVTLELGFDADATTEVVNEPTYDLDDRQVEEIVSGLLESAPSALSDSLEISGERDLNYVSLENPSVDVHGAQFDHVTVGATVTPNPEALTSTGE
jgi:hypothetical protein